MGGGPGGTYVETPEVCPREDSRDGLSLEETCDQAAA